MGTTQYVRVVLKDLVRAYSGTYDAYVAVSSVIRDIGLNAGW